MKVRLVEIREVPGECDVCEADAPFSVLMPGFDFEACEVHLAMFVLAEKRVGL